MYLCGKADYGQMLMGSRNRNQTKKKKKLKIAFEKQTQNILVKSP